MLEKLVLQCFVDKANRKLTFAVCLFLAFKFCEGSSAEQKPIAASIDRLVEAIELALGVVKKDIIKNEMAIFSQLGFELHVRKDHFMPHFTRLLKTIELTPASYLGRQTFNFYFPPIDAAQEDKVDDFRIDTVSLDGSDDTEASFAMTHPRALLAQSILTV